MSSKRNYRNLGYGVTTRLMSWEQAVRDAEGSRWNYPYAIYLMETEAGLIPFVNYDVAVTGPDHGTRPIPPVLTSCVGNS